MSAYQKRWREPGDYVKVNETELHRLSKDTYYSLPRLKNEHAAI